MLSRLVTRSVSSVTRTVRAATFVRCFSNVVPAKGAAAPAKQASSGSAVQHVKTLKQDLMAQIDEDIKEVNGNGESEQELANYVKDRKWRVNVSKDFDSITCTKSSDNHLITVTFGSDELMDENNPYGQNEDDGYNQEPELDENGNEIEPHEQDAANGWASHPFAVEIKALSGKPGSDYLRLQCMATQNHELQILAVQFTEPTESAAGNPQGMGDLSAPSQQQQVDEGAYGEALPFDELTIAMQDKLSDLLRAFTVDDLLAGFVQQQAQFVRKQRYLNKLTKLNNFLQN